MTKHRGLGRGLAELIPTGDPLEGEDAGVREVAIADIEPNPEQPRSDFEPGALQELADSIRTYGLLQPLVVEVAEGHFQLVAGERRLRAAQLAGMTRVPVVVRAAGPDRERLEMALVENLQRRDISPLDEARAFTRLCDQFGLTQDQVAKRVGRSRSAVANTMRLLQATAEVQLALARQEISSAHARSLLALTEPAFQLQALQLITSRRLSVRETEKLVARMQDRRRPAPATPAAPQGELLPAIAEALTAKLSTRVTITPRPKGRGRIVIDYFSEDELVGLCERLGVDL